MASKSYIAPETAVTWSHSGVGDLLLDLRNLGPQGDGQLTKCGAYHDLGPGPRSYAFELTTFIDGFRDGGNGFAPEGKQILIYVAQSDNGVDWDGPPTTAPTDSAHGEFSVAQLESRNVLWVDSLIVPSSDPAVHVRRTCHFCATGRYIAPVVRLADDFGFNRVNFNGTHLMTLRPIPSEAQ
jgi:hypothetical protein